MSMIKLGPGTFTNTRGTFSVWYVECDGRVVGIVHESDGYTFGNILDKDGKAESFDLGCVLATSDSRRWMAEKIVEVTIEQR